MKAKKVAYGHEAELRRKAEAVARGRAGTTSDMVRMGLSGEGKRLLQELQVHQIELELQNEELHRAELELELERARWFDLYDLAPMGFCNLDEAGRVVDANLAFASLLGMDRTDLDGQPFTAWVAEESQDLFYLERKKLNEGGKGGAYELRMKPRDGSTLWVSVNATIGLDSVGHRVCRLGLGDITARKKAEEALQKSLGEKETLLREVHHRVKNNLNVISSLLSLQADNIASPEDAIVAFRKTRDRIMAMALVHEELYRSDDYSRVDMQEFIRKLTRHLQDVYCPGGNIRLTSIVDGIHLDVSQSIPCGLILNELITNAFKYAFPRDGGGKVDVSFRSVPGDRIEFVIRDNGVGLPHRTEDEASHSLGLTLVKLLVEQLEGSLAFDSAQGVEFRIIFPSVPSA